MDHQLVKAEFHQDKEGFTSQVKAASSNGHLPDFILSPDDAGIWRIVDRHGNLFAGGNRYLRGRALLSLLQEAGVSYKIINPKRHQKGTQQKGNPPK